MRANLYNNYIAFAFSFCPSEKCSSTSDEHYPGFMIFSYPNGDDFSLNLIDIMFSKNEIIDNYTINLENQVRIDNNLFGLDFDIINIQQYSNCSSIKFVSSIVDYVNIIEGYNLGKGENIIAKEIPIEKDAPKKINKKYLIIIISIINVLCITIFLIVLFKYILKPKEKKFETRNTDMCLKFVNSISDECQSCRNKFYLYKGKCIPYAFYVEYKVDYINEKVKLFNPSKKTTFISLKINKNILDPISEYIFDKIGNNKVYYFILDNNIISLSNMFENINKLGNFSFNDNFVNSFNIIDMKGMFHG
jgi:hypothetical protein